MGIGDRGGLSMGGQMHKNRLAEIARTAQQTGAGTTQIGNSGRTQAGITHDVFGGMARDYRNDGNSTLDSVGNGIAGMFGFNEMAPTKAGAFGRVAGTASPTSTGVDNRASWGFDPVGALAGAAGMAVGIPGLGLVANQISSALGRPLEMDMGPSVFGADGTPSHPSGPADFETASGASGGAPASGLGGQVSDHESGGPNDGRPSVFQGLSQADLSRSLSFLTGRPVNAASMGSSAGGTTGAATGSPTGTDVSGTSGGLTNANAAADPLSTLSSFGGPSAAVAASRSPFNNRIGSDPAGGFAIGGRSKKTSPTALAEGLGRSTYRSQGFR